MKMKYFKALKYTSPECSPIDCDTETTFCTSIQNGSTSGYGYNDEYEEME